MANTLQNTKSKASMVIRSDAFRNMFESTLGDKETAKQLITDLVSATVANPKLNECDPQSLASAGLQAQSCGLSVSPTLGLCYLIPYGNKAQFQLSYIGLVNLVMNTGTVERVGAREVHKGELVGVDEFGDDVFKFSHEHDGDEVIGYFAYIKLINGFKKTLFWSNEQIDAHAKKYSKSFGNGSATDNWTNMRDIMAKKTVLKQLLKVYAPKSTKIQRALTIEQASIDSEGNAHYIDNESGEVKEIEKPNNNKEVDIADL